MTKLNKDYFFYLHKWCIPVKGVNRSTINDFQRGTLKLIPNELYDLLVQFKGKQIKEAFNHFVKEEKDIEVLEEYFVFLLEQEFIFLSIHPELEFNSKMNTDFSFPQEMNNCIIDYNLTSSYSIKKVIEQLNDLGCQSIQFRLYDIFSLDFVIQILELTNNTTIRNVELTLKYVDVVFKDKIKALIDDKYRRVLQVIFHSSPEIEIESELINDVSFIYSKNEINSCQSCGSINPLFFEVNQVTYLLGKNHNTCLYKKVSIDIDGNIKNCPSMIESFGNISDVLIQNVLQLEELKKHWNTTKSEIDECKECEFRMVCTDCRAYIENKKTGKPKKCNYDVYSSTWVY